MTDRPEQDRAQPRAMSKGHNLDVINASERHAGGMPPSEHADWVVDLGPGGGVNGGEIVVAGTPEVVAAEPQSYTGQYLKSLLERAARAPAEARVQATLIAAK